MRSVAPAFNAWERLKIPFSRTHLDYLKEGSSKFVRNTCTCTLIVTYKKHDPEDRGIKLFESPRSRVVPEKLTCTQIVQ
jgi:hypothetical protein